MAARPLTIRNTALPAGTVGKTYHLTLAATGGAYPTYVWSVAHGKLPDGLGLSAGGMISGMPARAGRFTFTIGVNDPVEKTYAMTIKQAATTTPTKPPASSGTGRTLANSGSDLGPLTATGFGAVLLGLVMLALAARSGGHPMRGRRPKH